MAAKDDVSLTGVWHGLYTYASHPHLPESHFICVMIDNGCRLSGSIHEEMNQYGGSPTEAFALIDGAHCGGHVTFLKTYDGTGGRTHGVSYAGILQDDQDEIEGEWHINGRHGVASGHFLMIRKRGRTEARAAGTEAHEKAQ